MYVRVLFLLCAYLKINNADTDSDEAKYIDLLPEEEKQEFLNRITKRIVAEIRSGSRPDRTSVEISDERLNEHSAYVQKIMGEESETLKNNRRHERENKAENDENFEFKVKPLHDIEEQGNTDILDLPIVESKRRTRKDTYENSKQMSMEKAANHGDNVSAIPVNLLYDDENDLKNTVTEKTAVSKDEIKEEEDETLLEVEGLNTEKSVKEIQNSKDSENMGNKTEITDIKNKSMEIVSKEESEIHIIRKSNPFIDVNEEENVTDILQTITKDYETHDKAIPEVNEELIVKDTVESKSREITGKEIETDFPKITLQMPITELSEMDVESTTDNVFNIFSSGTERDVLNKSLSAENINEESTYVTESDYISTQNSTMTDLPPTLIKENFLYTDKKNINDIINGTKQNVIKTATNENLEPATPSVDFRIELTTSESPVEGVNGDEIEFTNYTKNIGTGNNVKEDENINKVNIKPVLRKGSDHLEESRNKNVHHSKTSDVLLPNGENNINHYHVFEISNKKPPLVPKEEVSFEVAEEPHYIPVYNYEPKNAFYTAYNHYGPNFNEHDKFKTKVSNQHGDDTFNNQNIERDYTNTGQRYFKPYITNNIYHRPRSIAYQSNLVPVWKDKFPVINFNPNDYLDVDYYLGRSNDASEHNDIGIKHKPQSINHKYVTSKDNTENIIDSDSSVEQQNVKENIKELRHKLFIQKYGKKAGARQTHDKYSQNLKDKLQGQEKNLDPILRGLDDTLLIFLPEGGSKHMKNYDFVDNNIAVDYYFSRMKSEEHPLFNENNIKISDKVSNVDESKMGKYKKGSEEHEQITDEKHVQIPLKHDHVLKINIGVKMGNKVDVIFRNVKKPERNKFEVYLKAYLDVLKDMIEHDNKGLMLYDWLGTTVDVQSAIRKLLDLIKSLQAREQIHYSDFELIKYAIHIFRSSNTLIKKDSEKSVKHTINRKQIPERNGKRKMPRVINKIKTITEKPIDTLKKVLKHVKEIQQLSIEIDDDVLVEFETFLTELQTSLYEIHGAIKQIATVTKFRKQSWFHDIKALYLTPVNRNALLRLLLHLASSKLFGLIEESAKNGLEDNFIIFAQNHRAEVDRTREEFIFVIRLLEELKHLKY